MNLDTDAINSYRYTALLQVSEIMCSFFRSLRNFRIEQLDRRWFNFAYSYGETISKSLRMLEFREPKDTVKQRSSCYGHSGIPGAWEPLEI